MHRRGCVLLCDHAKVPAVAHLKVLQEVCELHRRDADIPTHLWAAGHHADALQLLSSHELATYTSAAVRGGQQVARPLSLVLQLPPWNLPFDLLVSLASVCLAHDTFFHAVGGAVAARLTDAKALPDCRCLATLLVVVCAVHPAFPLVPRLMAASRAQPDCVGAVKLPELQACLTAHPGVSDAERDTFLAYVVAAAEAWHAGLGALAYDAVRQSNPAAGELLAKLPNRQQPFHELLPVVYHCVRWKLFPAFLQNVEAFIARHAKTLHVDDMAHVYRYFTKARMKTTIIVAIEGALADPERIGEMSPSVAQQLLRDACERRQCTPGLVMSLEAQMEQCTGARALVSCVTAASAMRLPKPSLFQRADKAILEQWKTTSSVSFIDLSNVIFASATVQHRPVGALHVLHKKGLRSRTVAPLLRVGHGMYLLRAKLDKAAYERALGAFPLRDWSDSDLTHASHSLDMSLSFQDRLQDEIKRRGRGGTSGTRSA